MGGTERMGRNDSDVEDGSEEEYNIEEILGRRVRRGLYEYHCKWLGYPSDDNTWEKREDLVADGFEDVVDKHDEMLKREEEEKKKGKKKKAAVSTKKKAAASSKKARSKTPAKRTTAKKAPPASGNKDAEEAPQAAPADDTESASASEGNEASGTLSATVEAYLNADAEMHSFIWTWLFLFLLSAVISIALYAVKEVDIKDEDVKYGVNVASIVFAICPMAVSVWAIVRNCSSDFSNMAAVTCVWIAMTKFTEGYQKVFQNTGDYTTWTMALWSLASWAALYQDAERLVGRARSSEEAKWNKKVLTAMSCLGYTVWAGAIYYHQQSPKGIDEFGPYVCVFLVLAALTRVTARLIFSMVASKSPLSLSDLIELVAILCGSAYIMFALIETNDTYQGRLREWFKPRVGLHEIDIKLPGSGKNEGTTLALPVFTVLRDMLAWGASASMTLTALLYHR